MIAGAAPQPVHAKPFRFEPLHDLLDLRRLAAHHLVRAVVRRDTQPQPFGCRVPRFERLRNVRRGREYCRHRTRHRQRRHQLAARRGEPQPVLEAEHASRLRRRDLSEAVPHYHVRTDAQARPQRCQPALERVRRGLRPRGVVEVTRGVGAAEQHVQQRCAAMLLHPSFAPVQHRAEDRLALVQRLPHPGPLAALAGVDERHLRRRPRLRPVGLVPIHDGLQRLAQRRRVAEDDACAVREVASPDARRPRHVG